jgi:hypothetical protein
VIESKSITTRTLSGRLHDFTSRADNDIGTHRVQAESLTSNSHKATVEPGEHVNVHDISDQGAGSLHEEAACNGAMDDTDTVIAADVAGDSYEDVAAARLAMSSRVVMQRDTSTSTAEASMAHSLPGCMELGLPPVTLHGQHSGADVLHGGSNAALEDTRPGLLSDSMFHFISK